MATNLERWDWVFIAILGVSLLAVLTWALDVVIKVFVLWKVIFE